MMTKLLYLLVPHAQAGTIKSVGQPEEIGGEKWHRGIAIDEVREPIKLLAS